MAGALAGKVAIVTGASRGIGRAIAERLGADGAQVVVHYAQNEQAAWEVVQAIENRGGQAGVAQADISRVDDVRRLFAQAHQRHGRLDILVNNAGAAHFAPLADVTEEDFDRQFALNAKGAFFAMQAAARVLEDGGRIVNISSGVTQVGSANAAVYAGSKAALEQFTLAAARELGARGITVNTVSPGMTATDLLELVVPPGVQAQMREQAPLGRLGQPVDIADIVAFVVSEQARWLTGQNIRATGGAL